MRTTSPHSGRSFRVFVIAGLALTLAVPGLAQAPTSLEVQEAAFIQRLTA